MALPRTYATLEVIVDETIAFVFLSRPTQANSITQACFDELTAAFDHLATLPSVRAVVLAGRGKAFCGGIDLALLHSLLQSAAAEKDGGRRGLRMAHSIQALQHSISSPERYPFPVIAAITGACVGGGVDLAAACDVRFCSANASFSVKETDVGLPADLGSLQRLPGLIGEGRTRELALTCRAFSGQEAESYGFVTRVFESPEATVEAARDCALALARKSPMAIAGTKAVLLQQRRAALSEGLEAIAWRNAATLAASQDVEECLRARAERRSPVFAKL